MILPLCLMMSFFAPKQPRELWAVQTLGLPLCIATRLKCSFVFSLALRTTLRGYRPARAALVFGFPGLISAKSVIGAVVRLGDGVRDVATASMDLAIFA